MTIKIYRNLDLSVLVFAALFLGIASITFGTTNVFASSDDGLPIRENKTFLSQLTGAGEASDYLQAIRQPGGLWKDFDLFNNGQRKLSPDDFAGLGELDEGSLAPEIVVCSNVNFAANNFGNGNELWAITTGDFNGDGRLDVVATGNLAQNTVSVKLGNGTGGFIAGANFTVGVDPRSVTTGDFNGDGRLDIATANNTSNNVSVLLGNGTGGFGAATNFGAGVEPRR